MTNLIIFYFYFLPLTITICCASLMLYTGYKENRNAEDQNILIISFIFSFIPVLNWLTTGLFIVFFWNTVKKHKNK